MIQEELKDLLKFIIRKCDLVINNKNYTADEYAQDKVEDIAEICHRVLDGQFGEIIEPSLPSNLDEAARLSAVSVPPIWPEKNIESHIRGFKAGAEWMAGQGVKAHCVESSNPVSDSKDENLHLITLVYAENENTPYVLAGDEVEIILRKKQ